MSTSRFQAIVSKLNCFPSPTYNFDNKLDDTFSKLIKLSILVLSILVGIFILLGIATTCYLVYAEAQVIKDELEGYTIAFVWIEFTLICLRMPFLAFIFVVLLVGIIAAFFEFTVLLCIEIVLLTAYVAILFVSGAHTIAFATLAYDFEVKSLLVVLILYVISALVGAILIIFLILACCILANRIKPNSSYTTTEEQL